MLLSHSSVFFLLIISVFLVLTYSVLWRKTRTSRASSCEQEWTRRLSFMSSRPPIRNWLLRGKITQTFMHTHTHTHTNTKEIFKIAFEYHPQRLRPLKVAFCLILCYCELCYPGFFLAQNRPQG